MQIVFVQVQVIPECVAAFIAATQANACASLQEPGVARFDLCQSMDDPSRFTLLEVYRDAAAVAAHKETTHYKVWRDCVASMMAQPRVGNKYVNLYPSDGTW